MTSSSRSPGHCPLGFGGNRLGREMAEAGEAGLSEAAEHHTPTRTRPVTCFRMSSKDPGVRCCTRGLWLWVTSEHEETPVRQATASAAESCRHVAYRPQRNRTPHSTEKQPGCAGHLPLCLKELALPQSELGSRTPEHSLASCPGLSPEMVLHRDQGPVAASPLVVCGVKGLSCGVLLEVCLGAVCSLVLSALRFLSGEVCCGCWTGPSCFVPSFVLKAPTQREWASPGRTGYIA